MQLAVTVIYEGLINHIYEISLSWFNKNTMFEERPRMINMVYCHDRNK